MIVKEKGAALIVVLSFLVLVGMIGSTIVTISQKSSRKIKVETDRVISAYLAEGAVSRLQWLMMDGIQKNTNRNTASRFDNSSMSKVSKYIAVGRPISIHYYDAMVTARIFDMASGFNVSGSIGYQPIQSLIQAYSMFPSVVANLKIFLNRFSDYIIPGLAGKSANGMSKGDYTALGLYPLPRNDQLQYRDEVLWIPGSGNLLIPDEFGRLSELNIVPPQNMYFYINKINFFSANKTMIMSQCNFNEDEANAIVQGRDNWLKSDSNFSIYKFIDTNYMMTLTQRFSFQDSGFYTIVITASQGEGFYERMLIVSAKIGPVSGNTIEYYEYLVY